MPVRCLELIEQPAGLGHRFVAAVVGRAHDHHEADGVLVAELHRLFGREVKAVALHRHQPRFDVPVVHELVPADLGVHAHHQVGAVGGLARRPPPVLPAALEGEAAQHAGLARAGGRAADRLLGDRRVPQPREHVHAAQLELGRLRVLVLVDHVLVERLGHEAVGLRLHPGRHERGQVEPRVAVEHELVVDDLVGGVGRHAAGRQSVTRHARELGRKDRRYVEVARHTPCTLGMVERHLVLLAKLGRCLSK